MNYTQLEELYEKYKSEAGGFTVLAFPCNQFGAQVGHSSIIDPWPTEIYQYVKKF